MKQRKVQNSFLSGVLDPRASARVGTETYENGLLVGRNVIPVHLGGVRRRPGMKFVNRLPYQLTMLTPSAATAPNGGTAADAHDNDLDIALETVNSIGTNNPYVIARYDLGASLAVRYIDVLRTSLTAGSDDYFVVQWSDDDVAWTSLSTPILLDTVERTYRVLADVTARYWRFARVDGVADLSTATAILGEMRVWAETSTMSAVRIIPFMLNTNQEYAVVLTDRSGAIYADGEIVPGAYFPTPYVSADLADIDATVGADSLFLVHEDYVPRFVSYEPTGTGLADFQSDEVEFTFIPKHDFADSSSPTPVSAVQEITFSSGWIRGDTFQIELDGARTAAIAYAGDSTADEQTATAANIAREVQKLYTVLGNDGVSCARTGALEYTVTFAGASAAAYGLMSVLPLVTDGTATATATVLSTATGTSRYENVWSATRGYPKTTAFFEGRWYFGGSRELPKTWWGSAVNDVLNFDDSRGFDADALSGTFDGGSDIVGIYPGRNLQIFTSAGEFRYIKQPGEAITPADVPRRQTEYGSRKIRPVNIDGASIFVQRFGKSVRDFKYDVNEDAYNSLSLSSLAPHLLNDVVDLAAWNGSLTDEISLVFVVNGDGTVAVLNTRREADVTAWSQWVTGSNAVFDDDANTVTGQDEIKAVGVAGQDIYFATKRTIGGESVLYLEIADEDMRMDAAVLKQYNNLVDQTIGMSAEPLIGEECRVTVAGLVVDNVTPIEGLNVIATTYPIDAFTEVRLGLNFDPKIRPMPLTTVNSSGVGLIGKQRIAKVKLKVRNTLGLLINGRVIPDRRFDVSNFDEPQEPVSGNVSLEETTNWDETQDKLVDITQVDPAPLEILGIEVVMEGGN